MADGNVTITTAANFIPEMWKMQFLIMLKENFR